MKKILVPTDFSPNAEKALDYAVQLAKKAKARIILIHACDLLLNLAFKDNSELKKEYNRKVIKEAREKLSLCKQSIKSTEKVAIETHLYEGLVIDTILDAVKLHKADLIIIGTLGDAGASERIFGSKTAAVIGKSTVPVLAVPLLCEWKEPSSILLALNNFNEGSPLTIHTALDIASFFKSRITITKFLDGDSAADYKQITIEKAGNSYARRVQDLVKNVQVDFVPIKGQRFEKTLQTYIIKNNIDLLVMITHRRNFLNSLFHRSLTKKMSYHSNIPLLALPAIQKTATSFHPEKQWINQVVI